MPFNTVQSMEQAFTMQSEFIKGIKNLIAYDKEHAEQPENTKLLEGFCETPEKALNKALLLLQKHKESLVAEEQKEIEKRHKNIPQDIETEKHKIPTEDTEQESLFGEEDT